jgi:holo-[acyl-carrier protein] synthase
MILGTGIDIVEIERIRKAVDRWGRNFLDHIFNEEEIAYAQQHKFPAQHYAARFAAKEAVYKAFGDNKTLGWKDMIILNDKNGKPYCLLKDKTFKHKLFISISHSKYYAVANAVIEQAVGGTP